MLEMGLDLYFIAWLELNSCRSVGLGLGPIPWIAVYTYSKEFEFNPDQCESLHHHIRAMDKVYFEWVEKNNKPPPSPKKKPQ